MGRGRAQLRISIVGPSGSGKSTLARRLAQALDLPHVELDAINWQAGWRGLNEADPAEFARRIGEATAGERWVVDGNYSAFREAAWARATDVVWLDFGPAVFLPRVLRRSFLRAWTGREL